MKGVECAKIAHHRFSYDSCSGVHSDWVNAAATWKSGT